MTEKYLANLIAVIEQTIHLAAILIDSAKITDSDEHRADSIKNATVACESAQRYIGKVPAVRMNPSWYSHLTELKEEIQAHISKCP